MELTCQEAAIIETYTGVVMLVGDKRKFIYDYAEKIMGRPVYTHEFATLCEELKEKSNPDFIRLCQRLEDGDKLEDDLK